MKAFEANKRTTQAQYELIIQKINSALEKGLSSLLINDCKEISDEVIEMIAKDGFNVNVNYWDKDSLGFIQISWKNAKEGMEGVITKKVENGNTPTLKKSFWSFISDGCEYF